VIELYSVSVNKKIFLNEFIDISEQMSIIIYIENVCYIIMAVFVMYMSKYFHIYLYLFKNILSCQVFTYIRNL
jgi:hypothetical protein